MASYYDDLELIRKIAAVLQRSPVPDDTDDCKLLVGDIQLVKNRMQQMLRWATPYMTLWVGGEDTSTPPGMLRAKEVEGLLES